MSVGEGHSACPAPRSYAHTLTCLVCFSSMFIRKVGWESCGRDGCGEEDGGSKVRRWRHLKSHGHQGLWNGKVVN